MNKYLRFITFLIFNFLALYVGVLLMNDGPRTDWYQSLQKAPWTPANWVFGAAWTTIMILFSFYMTQLSYKFKLYDKRLLVTYILQWILNVSWNLFFFNKHETVIGLFLIVFLWLLIGYITFKHIKQLKYYTLLIIPYLVWMTIATSLNLYIVLNN